MGTNPVSVEVADVNADGRPDLIVANKGSNDISVLVSDSTPSAIAFEPQRRFEVGAGPVALLYGNFNRDAIPDILVSDAGSRDLRLLPGVGNGFYNDSAASVFPLAEIPGAIFAGPFEGGSSLDIVALDPGTSNVTLISGILTGTPVTEIFSSGGFDPVAALAVLGSSGFLDLVVVNNGDGSVAYCTAAPTD